MSRQNQIHSSFYFLFSLFCCCCDLNQLSFFVDSFQVNISKFYKRSRERSTNVRTSRSRRIARPNQFHSSFYFLLFLFSCCCDLNRLPIFVDSFQINSNKFVTNRKNWRQTTLTTSKVKGYNLRYQEKGLIRSNSNLLVAASTNNKNNEEASISLPEISDSKTKEKNKSTKQTKSTATKKKTTTKQKQTKPATAPAPTKRSWEENFQRLREYKQEYGDCLVPQEYKKDKKLGIWVHTQRQSKKMGKLKPEREDQLNEIGFSWEALTDTWDSMFEELVEFQEEHGHCNVELNKYKSQNKLAKWVMRQRQSAALLTEDQRSKLNKLGFVWKDVKKARGDRQWEERFELLQDYKRIHGNTLVPQIWSSNNGVRLGEWVSNQRRYYREGILQKVREAKLKSIGFVWKVREGKRTDWELMDKIWMKSFEKLKEFKTIHNNTNVPCEYEENPELGLWVYTQRQRHRLGLLKEHRQELLEDLGFEWKLKEKTFKEQWMDQYQNLVAFQKEYGHVDVPHSSHQDLYHWLHWQRTVFANDKLELERKELLEKIGVDLNVGPGSPRFEEQ